MAKYVHVFMLILVLHVLESAFANKYSSLSHADECSLLFQFKETMSINKSVSVSGYPKVASWNLNTSDCCLWDGVECRFSHVIGLDLSRSFLYGPISSNNTLFNLIHLRTLNLAYNDFRNSIIPSGMGKLSQLSNLNLSYSGFSGEVPKQISQLRNLVSLDLTGKWRRLKLQSLVFQNLVQNSSETLRELFLSGVEIDSELPASIGNLTHLNRLGLGDCAFTGTLPTSISNLTQLTYLDLSDNKFTGSLPSLESFTNLTYLSLSDNSFDRWKLPNWFGKLNKITHLYLGDVNVTVDFSLFLSLKKLELIYLINATLSVTDSLTNATLPKFKELALVSCNLKVFPKFLRFQHQLEFLILDNNNIEGLIPGWMWNISKETLRLLSLSQNLLTGFEQHSPVAPWVSLEYLDLSHNMLHGSIPVPPPTTIMYYVSNNNLIGEIPPPICDLMSLELLDLSFNNITGSIPPCLEKLSNSNLTVLKLRSNNLQGTIPNIFTTKSRLEVIDFSENKLEGQVPRSLENCESLQILDLGYNLIEGMFPFWLGALTELKVLILRFNNFHGNIKLFGDIKVNFPKLHIIDLSHNSFSGDLPHQYFQEWSAMKEDTTDTTYMQTFFKEYSLIRLYSFSIQMTNKGVKMEYEEIMNIFFAVDLSSNMFRGKIPESIKTLSGLRMLNLSNNELSGIIPPSMGNIIQLEALDLSGNKLSGIIPQDLVQLNFLEFLNVSNNNLTGPIPQGKQFNTFSNNSYIGNQALCGFPLSVKCGDSKPSKVLFKQDNDESDFPNGIDWAVILMGVVSGLVIGLVCGDHLTTRYYHWFS